MTPWGRNVPCPGLETISPTKVFAQMFKEKIEG
jgi:hypothetical protein